MRRSAAAAGIVLGLVLLRADDTKADPTARVASGTGTLVLVGEGEVAAPPDTAELTLAVNTENSTAKAALDEHTTTVAGLIARLEAQGITSADIRASGLSLRPRYSARRPADTGERVTLVGYVVATEVTLRIRNLPDLGSLVDRAVTAGANEVRGVTFDVANRGTLLDEARTRALRDAQHKASLLTQAAGLELGTVVSMNEDTSDSGGSVPTRAAPVSAGAMIVTPGQLVVRARLRLEWTLRPAR